jgi:hypothetical protein
MSSLGVKMHCREKLYKVLWVICVWHETRIYVVALRVLRQVRNEAIGEPRPSHEHLLVALVTLEHEPSQKTADVEAVDVRVLVHKELAGLGPLVDVVPSGNRVLAEVGIPIQDHLPAEQPPELFGDLLLRVGADPH